MNERDEVPLTRNTFATFTFGETEVCIWLKAKDVPRKIVLNGITEKEAFKTMLARFDARKVLGIDSEGYCIPKGSLQQFLDSIKLILEQYE